MSDNSLVNESVILAFVDTSAIDPMFNNFNNMEHLFVALKKHVDSYKLLLITHEISVREMECHIKDEISKLFEKYTAIQKSKELALLNGNKKYQFLFNNVDCEQIINDVIKELKNKLKEIGVKVLKTGSISTKKLLDDYFYSKPPFGAKNKKAEFPDAIMLQSLIKAVGTEHRIHIVANDGDWENVCKSNCNFLLHKNLNSLLDYINKDNVASTAIKTFLSEPFVIKEVTLKLEEIIRDMDFNVDGSSYDRKGFVEGYSYDETELIKVHDIAFVLHTIEDIDCSDKKDDSEITAIVTIVGSANVKFSCTYFDEENSIWDSEDHEYTYKEYGNTIETHEFLFPVRLTLTGDYKNNLEISDYTLIETEELNILDNRTLIDREYITDYYDPGFCVERVFACPTCKKEFKVDLISDGTECVSSSEKQMGTENEYNIDVTGVCRRCGETYHITGEVWEYPVNCCNYEQDIEINKAD